MPNTNPIPFFLNSSKFCDVFILNFSLLFRSFTFLNDNAYLYVILIQNTLFFSPTLFAGSHLDELTTNFLNARCLVFLMVYNLQHIPTVQHIYLMASRFGIYFCLLYDFLFYSLAFYFFLLFTFKRGRRVRVIHNILSFLTFNQIRFFPISSYSFLSQIFTQSFR